MKRGRSQIVQEKKKRLKRRGLAAAYISNASGCLKIDVDAARNRTKARCQRWHIYNETK